MLANNLLLITFLIGFFLTAIGLVRIYYKCPANQIIYRYIPRTFEQEQQLPVNLDQLYFTMFEEASPWVGSFRTRKKRREFGGDFISQGFHLRKDIRNINDDYISQG